MQSFHNYSRMSRKGGCTGLWILTVTVISVIEIRNFKNHLSGVLWFVGQVVDAQGRTASVQN